jgi:hypothetical protein
MSFWQKLFGGGPRQAPAADPDAPTQAELDALLPVHVGPYVRDPLTPPPHRNTPIYAHYRRGPALVFVELGLCADEAGARQCVETARAETAGDGTPQPAATRHGAPCFRTAGDLGAFIAWTRGQHYFSAHAKDGEPELDTFLQAFPH